MSIEIKLFATLGNMMYSLFIDDSTMEVNNDEYFFMDDSITNNLFTLNLFTIDGSICNTFTIDNYTKITSNKSIASC